MHSHTTKLFIIIAILMDTMYANHKEMALKDEPHDFEKILFKCRNVCQKCSLLLRMRFLSSLERQEYTNS